MGRSSETGTTVALLWGRPAAASSPRGSQLPSSQTVQPVQLSSTGNCWGHASDPTAAAPWPGSRHDQCWCRITGAGCLQCRMLGPSGCSVLQWAHPMIHILQYRLPIDGVTVMQSSFPTRPRGRRRVWSRGGSQSCLRLFLPFHSVAPWQWGFRRIR